MTRRWLWCLAAAMAAVCTLPGQGRTAAADCAVPPDLSEVSARLPHVAARLEAGKPVKIVAIGGASTRGAAAGDPERAYPHRLQVALAELFPKASISVANKGVPRQSTQQMLERFPADVFAEDPVLILWETGISDAVRGIDSDDFAAAVQAGIDAAKARSIDILLVDMQFSRSAAAVIDFERYLHALHRVGEMNEVYVFPRYAMMRYWSEQHMFSYDELPAAERAQVAAKVYDCIGRDLARAIRRAVQ